MPFISEVARWDKKRYSLYRCLSCGLIRPRPLPYQESTKLAVYDSEQNIRFFNTQTQKIQYESPEYRYFFKHFKHYLEFAKKYEVGKDHLDIGCGTGHMMYLFSKRGFRSEGQEISKKVAASLSDRFKVYCTDLSTMSTRKKYDFITMSQVLEHIEDPRKFLIDTNRLLKKGGYLMIGVPLISGLVPQILRTYWYGLGSGTHLNFFSEKNLPSLLEQTGFEVVEVRKTILDYTCIDFPKVLNLFAVLLSKTIESMGLGDNLYVIAQKKN